MRLIRLVLIFAALPMGWVLLANCGGPSNAPPPCSGQHDCAIDEQCYNNMCVRVLLPQPDGGGSQDQSFPPPPSCQAGQCSSNGQCLQVGNATCGVNGSPCIDCSAQGGCNFGTGQCLGGGPPPGCQPNQCLANGQCILSSDAACGLNGSTCVDCSAQGGCNLATGQCNGGGPPPTCGPSSCPSGCCQNGQCAQASNTACGISGSQCQDCSTQGGCNFATGQCNGGTPPPTCNATNCQTCCQNGQCIAPAQINDTACGARGVQCDNCTARGTTCDRPAGRCSGGNQPCGPTNCAGCCQNGQCVQASDASCGLSGSQCQNCSAQGGCNFGTGQCKGNTQSCGPTNCAGCCQNGQCVQPQQLSDFACGARGGQCSNCQSSNATCNKATGQCQSQSPTCGASNCPSGCCQNGQCITQISDVACGNAGQACVNCSAQSQSCDLTNKRCMAAPPTCGPANCSGCCQNGQCVTSINDRACGGNGGVCQNCSSTQQCDLTQKICINKPQNQYPSGPYGTSVGSVMSPNITFTECANESSGSVPSSTTAVFNSQIKVVLLTVHAGW